MNPDYWISVPNWDKFQHYKDRVPPWIKVYLELLDKDEFRDLSDAGKGLLLTVWLLHARHRGPFSCTTLATYVRDRRTLRHLESLNHAGFITISASRALAQRRKEVRRTKTGTQPPLPRAAAAAYQPFEETEVDDHDYVPLEQIETYLAELRSQ